MDLCSDKRTSGWKATLRKGSRSATRDITGSRDEPAQFCNRIGCNGRLNHTKVVTNVKKPLQESRKNPSSKTEQSNKIHENNTSESSQVKIKSKSRESESNKGVLKSDIRKVDGQKPGLANQDGQIGSFDRKNTVKKRLNEGETSSSARGKKISEPSSVRTRRSVNQHGNSSSSVQSSETSSNGSSPNGGSLSGQYNVDAIANVLLALERIDQDEGLTYEQILSLEGNSFLGGFELYDQHRYDQHRDMRLDIDNMSYEELLVLEERMGIVSTALSEEELSKCLRISTYKPLRGSWCLDDTKCSICQEEFIAADEIGRLECDHGYHAECINQWLRLKNWCPICKVSAKPSHSL